MMRWGFSQLRKKSFWFEKISAWDLNQTIKTFFAAEFWLFTAEKTQMEQTLMMTDEASLTGSWTLEWRSPFWRFVNFCLQIVILVFEIHDLWPLTTWTLWPTQKNLKGTCHKYFLLSVLLHNSHNNTHKLSDGGSRTPQTLILCDGK